MTRIIDCHHHLWDLRNHPYPWLKGPPVPKPFGDYAALRRDYLVTDFLRDVLPLGVVASVHADAGFDPDNPAAETAWLQSVTDAVDMSRGFPQGIVGHVDLASADAQAVIEAHCQNRNMRGVRQILTGGDGYPTSSDKLKNATWQANAGLLRRYGLSLDLQIHPLQVEAVAGLAARYADLTIIVGHCGTPIDRSESGVALWQRGMAILARHPNIAVKLSGFGIYDPHWTVDSIRPVVLRTIELFGPDRCMFGSDFPVASLAATYARIWTSYDVITAGFSEAERDALFRGTAARLYRVDGEAR